MKIVLASTSPRRKELLGMIFPDFTVRPSLADEKIDHTTPLFEIPRVLAERKALAVDCSENEIVIGADTLVICDREPMGKPSNRAEAVKMLQKLSGKTHFVVSGICIRSREKVVSETVETKVTFRDLSQTEIETYVDEQKPFDKAGAYGIQESAGAFVSRIEGDYFNVVGLPLCRLTELLKEFSVFYGGKNE